MGLAMTSRMAKARTSWSAVNWRRERNAFRSGGQSCQHRSTRGSGPEKSSTHFTHLASSLAEGPDDGVEGPDDEESKGDLVEEVSDLGGSEEGVGSSRGDEYVEDEEHGEARDAVEAPPVLERWVQASNETGDDHHDVSNDDDDDLSHWETSEEGNVEEQQGGSVSRRGRRDEVVSIRRE